MHTTVRTRHSSSPLLQIGTPGYEANKWHAHQQVWFNYCINCHVCALFVNGHRLATMSIVTFMIGDVIAPCFLRQKVPAKAGTCTVRTLPLTSSYTIIPHYYSHIWVKHLEAAALWECNGGIEQKYNGGHEKTSGHNGVAGGWLHGSPQCEVSSWAWEFNYKLNNQPVRERVTASYLCKF